MTRLLRALPLVLVLAGCDRPRNQAIFAPHQEGLTLGYENPQLPFPQRREERLQVRVNRVVALPTGGSQVETAFTTLQGERRVVFTLEEGGVAQKAEVGPTLGPDLPKGFPGTTREWTTRNRQFSVVGQAMAVGLEVELPPSVGRLGTWVESRALDGKGAIIRTFYLPDLGAVESQELREGKWVCLKRLVARGFTDAPPRRAN